MEKDTVYYKKLFQKIDSGIATPEEIEEEKELIKTTDNITPALLEEMFMNMASNQQLKHFLIGVYCLYKACRTNNCIDILIDGMLQLGTILERSFKK